MATKDFKIRHSLTVSENATIEGDLTLGGKTVSRLIDSDEVQTIINNSSSGFDSDQIVTIISENPGSQAINTTVYTFTSPANDSDFSGTDDNGLTLAYEVNKIHVYLNGILLNDTVDYIATTGNSVVLANAPDSDDVLTVIKYLGTVQGFDNLTVTRFTYKYGEDGNSIVGDSEITGADESGNTLSYVAGKIQVYSNGILLEDSDDYIAIDGSTITLRSAPDSDDVVSIFKYLGTTQSGFDSDQVVAIINENLPVDQTGFDSDQVVAIINENSSGGGGAFTIDADDNMISSNSSASPTVGSGLRNIIAGTGAGTSITTTDDNIMIGTNSGSNVTTGYQNTLIGHMSTAHVLAGGDANTILGYNSGQQVTGDGNTVIGNLTTGDAGNFNTAVGQGTGWQFDGWYNTTIGQSSTSQGARTYTGGFVTGASAGRCVTIGYQVITSGQYSIGIGLEAATSGGDQIAIGRRAGYNNPVNTSKGSISIGTLAGQDNEADNTINIGYNAGMNFSSTANYNVNIGYEAASYTGYNPNSQYCVNIGYRAGLYARGDRNIAIGALTNGASNTAADARDNVCVGYYAGRVLTSGYENVFIGSNSDQTCQTGNANVVIGSTTNVSASNAVGQVVLGYGLNGQGNNTFRVKANSGSYNTQNSSTWTTTSDERIKTNVTEYTLGLDTLNQINVKTYNYLSDSDIATAHPELADSDGLVHEQLDTEKTIVGLMAQELEVVLPNSVTTRDNGIKAVNKDELFWVMLNSIKELKARVEALENN